MFTTSSFTVLFYVSNAETGEKGGAQPRAGPSESQLDGPAQRVSAGRRQAGQPPRADSQYCQLEAAEYADPAPPSSCPSALFVESCGDLAYESGWDNELRVEEAYEESEQRELEQAIREEATRGAFWREDDDDDDRVGELEYRPGCGRAERNVSGSLDHGYGEGRHRGVYE